MTTYETSEEAMVAADAEARASMEMYDFDGQNCDETLDDGDVCGGWDGYSRRCSCGNRRVTWSTTQHADGRWSAYAEAY